MVLSNDLTALVHHVPIGPHAIRVWVDVAKKPNAYLWRPTSEMTCIEKALGSTIAWPSDKVIIEVEYVLTTDLPFSDLPSTARTSSDLESSTGPSATATNQVKKDQVIDLEKYAKDNKTVRGHLLNYMSDPMFDLFLAKKSATDIWSTLESRYEGDDVG
ncbi:ty1-copia retrotransposon protein [Cucumis melo var. makuwa]|uniref:Ty1-copia retrotransposon protein n=1 Tax=Cucumis melo var. makuwa TaxID=1194695 RepID=A0A5D3BSB9_CUCMM|nr:ty1-copia retrotransposon protein [Cucumis melo var. makuwa]TYK01898.1 ty1-copia retrotransposon protein [Cucumis melo var. makuwa]